MAPTPEMRCKGCTLLAHVTLVADQLEEPYLNLVAAKERRAQLGVGDAAGDADAAVTEAERAFDEKLREMQEKPDYPNPVTHPKETFEWRGRTCERTKDIVLVSTKGIRILLKFCTEKNPKPCKAAGCKGRAMGTCQRFVRADRIPDDKGTCTAHRRNSAPHYCPPCIVNGTTAAAAGDPPAPPPPPDVNALPNDAPAAGLDVVPSLNRSGNGPVPPAPFEHYMEGVRPRVTRKRGRGGADEEDGRATAVDEQVAFALTHADTSQPNANTSHANTSHANAVGVPSGEEDDAAYLSDIVGDDWLRSDDEDDSLLNIPDLPSGEEDNASIESEDVEKLDQIALARALFPDLLLSLPQED
eukprot:CAMPEP_0206160008 /NCGR_PEP_ID=MMETSP1474-20131121/6368_1 /ASSEMBLY_ACC=CAM_ASM_001110 /TAXON_ID=97495 /ORGANISM="Imantonia sp., Strain RCC918" /LENGTH=356 /DNA_ID=CAMNT_0053561079 /DNA_START=46 /DNA_END=1116 /DNA_ORIENTATION=+